MLIYRNFRYTGEAQTWRVPEGVAEAFFECWGGAGGLPSRLSREGKVGVTNGGAGPRNDDFTNHPRLDGQLGKSYANNAGFAAGVMKVTEGDTFWINVGGNGKPGLSTIRKRSDGSRAVRVRGGDGGFNGGGQGGDGAHVYQNLYNSTSTAVSFSQAGIPSAANLGQLWRDTDDDLVRKCIKKYSGGTGTLGTNWTTVTDAHTHLVGPSGGGGGGATDIRKSTNELGSRILVAGGGGGAGGWRNLTGPDRWQLRRCPDAPIPPFGSDDESTGATGPNKTWASSMNYLVGGWGRGGIGGATGPRPGTLPTFGGGSATVGGSGGPASARHKEGRAPLAIPGSAGQGGDGVKGGAKGKGGTGGSIGTSGQGGNGASAIGGTDDFCAGGGGGGGGWFGGGGGGHGFKVTGDSADENSTSTHGGGGGGGSNYASPQLTAALLMACARPPAAKGGSDTGANGRGGFARITFHLPPRVRFTDVPIVADAGAPFSISFEFEPAREGGSKIAYYVVGTATDENATVPTSQTTIAIRDENRTSFVYTNFTAPANGQTDAYFVKVVDKDGDSSAWLKQKVRGLTAPVGATVTEPDPGDQFYGAFPLSWTLGTQSPLVAYRLGLSGTDLASGDVVDNPTGYRPGGTRVNLAKNPGFIGTQHWSSDFNADMAASATFPGISGSSGRIAWTAATDGSAEQHSTTWDNLRTDTTYRLSLDITSGTANDSRPVHFEARDASGVLAVYEVDFVGFGAGTYQTIDLEFTPNAQGVYFALQPTDSALVFGNAEAGQITHLANMLIEPMYESKVLMEEDFEDGANGWLAVGAATVAASTEAAQSGVQSLKITTTGINQGAQSPNGLYPVTPGMTVVGRGSVRAETAARSGSMRLTWFTAALGAISNVNGTAFTTTLEQWVEGSVTGTAPATAAWVVVWWSSTNSAASDIFHLDDISIRVQTKGTYFSGANANGNTGTVAWYGTANNSESTLVNTDKTSDTFTYTGPPLGNAAFYLETWQRDAAILGADPVRTSVSVVVTASTPATPTVGLTVDNSQGLMLLSLDAADSGVSNKTVSFDIIRNGVRVVTGLVPDETTRLAEYADIPGHAELATYVVRAFDSNGGYVEQSDGTVTVVN